MIFEVNDMISVLKNVIWGLNMLILGFYMKVLILMNEKGNNVSFVVNELRGNEWGMRRGLGKV